MGILTGSAIKDAVREGRIEISDFDEKRLNPNSYNMRLGHNLMAFTGPLDMRKKFDGILIDLEKLGDNGYMLEPDVLYLGSTIERVSTQYYVPLLHGRSSFGRLGISVHISAGFGDIGFNGNWTLGISCVVPVRVYSGAEVCQCAFHTPYGNIDMLYDGRYQNSVGINPSKF